VHAAADNDALKCGELGVDAVTVVSPRDEVYFSAAATSAAQQTSSFLGAITPMKRLVSQPDLSGAATSFAMQATLASGFNGVTDKIDVVLWYSDSEDKTAVEGEPARQRVAVTTQHGGVECAFAYMCSSGSCKVDLSNWEQVGLCESARQCYFALRCALNSHNQS
jgi:hypothetical protein